MTTTEQSVSVSDLATDLELVGHAYLASRATLRQCWRRLKQRTTACTAERGRQLLEMLQRTLRDLEASPPADPVRFAACLTDGLRRFIRHTGGGSVRDATLFACQLLSFLRWLEGERARVDFALRDRVNVDCGLLILLHSPQRAQRHEQLHWLQQRFPDWARRATLLHTRLLQSLEAEMFRGFLDRLLSAKGGEDGVLDSDLPVAFEHVMYCATNLEDVHDRG